MCCGRNNALWLVVCVSLWAGPVEALRRPDFGGVLRIATVEPLHSASPVRATTFSEWLAIGLAHEGLYGLDASGAPQPNLLVEPCKRRSAGRAWRCTLRPGVRFHDGSLLRAADVKSSLARRTGPARAWVRSFIRVAIRDDRSFELTLARPADAREFGLLMAGPAMAIWRERGAAGIGLGPFRVTRWHPEQGAVDLEAHAQYHGGRPYLDGVKLRVVERQDDAIEAFHYGKADLVFVDSERYEGAVRVKGPMRETVGLLVRKKSATWPSSRRKIVAGKVPRSILTARVSGQTRAATRLIPHANPPSWSDVLSLTDPVDFRWFIGTALEWEQAARTVASSLGGAAAPWPIQPLDRWTLHRAVDSGTGRWDALLISWYHTDPSGRAALRTLASLALLPSVADLRTDVGWVPMVDRARVCVYKEGWQGIRWSDTGLLHLADAWRP